MDGYIKVLDFGLQNCGRKDVCYFNPPSLWSFVTAALGRPYSHLPAQPYLRPLISCVMKVKIITTRASEDYYSAIKRNKIELFIVRWMDLESVKQSEVTQKEKNKYRMLTHIYGI